MRRTLLALSVLILAVSARAGGYDTDPEAAPNQGAADHEAASDKKPDGTEKIAAAAAVLDDAGRAVYAAEVEARQTPPDPAAFDKLNTLVVTKYGPALDRFNAAVAAFDEKGGSAEAPAAPKHAMVWPEIDQAANATIAQGCPGAPSSQKQLTKMCRQLAGQHAQIAAMMQKIELSPEAKAQAAAAAERGKQGSARANARIHPVFGKVVNNMSDKDLAALYTGANKNAPTDPKELARIVADIKANPDKYYGTGDGKIAVWDEKVSQAQGTDRARTLMVNQNGKQVPVVITQAGGASKSFAALDAGVAAKQVSSLMTAGRPVAASAAAFGAAMVQTAAPGADAAAAGKNLKSAALPQLPPAQASAEEALKKEREQDAQRHSQARGKISQRLIDEDNAAAEAKKKAETRCGTDSLCKETAQIDFNKRTSNAMTKAQAQLATENVKEQKRQAGFEKSAQSGAAVAEKAIHDRLDLLKPDYKPIQDYFSGPVGKAREQYIVDQCAGRSLKRGLLFGWNVDDSGTDACIKKSVSDELENRVKIGAAPSVAAAAAANAPPKYSFAYVPPDQRAAAAGLMPMAGQSRTQAAINADFAGNKADLLSQMKDDNGKSSPAAALKGTQAPPDYASAPDSCPSHLVDRNPDRGAFQPLACVASCPPGSVKKNGGDWLGKGMSYCDDGKPFAAKKSSGVKAENVAALAALPKHGNAIEAAAPVAAAAPATDLQKEADAPAHAGKPTTKDPLGNNIIEATGCSPRHSGVVPRGALMEEAEENAMGKVRSLVGGTGIVYDGGVASSWVDDEKSPHMACVKLRLPGPAK